MAYLWATLLLLVNVAAWISTLFLLPGNWVIVALAALYAWLLEGSPGPHLSWTVVLIVLGLAILGEVVEFAAGAMGASRRGGSRRGMLLAVVGTFAGSLIGAGIGVPVPVVGPIIGALGLGTLGAFVGAYLGETWAGRSHAESVHISNAAMVGRVLGTTGKMLIGILMVVLITLDSFFDFAT